MSQNALALISEDASLQFALLDDDGEVQVETRLEMARERLLFMWPSWSPDGAHLAVSASSKDPDTPRLDLWRVPLAEGETQPIFRNPRDGLQQIAPGLSHYVHWAPGGRALAVVANVGSGLAINLVAASGQGDPRRLIDGAPIYFAWAPDGRAVLVHRNYEVILFDLAQGGGPRQILRGRPSFRAPAWSQAGDAFFYATPRSGHGSMIMRGHRASEERKELMELPRPVAFVRAPNDDRLAVLALREGDREGVNLTILDPDQGEQRQLSTRTVNGVFWSPDGRALYAFEPQPSSTMIALTRYDVGAGERPMAAPGERLARFQPSAEFATMLTFFDQFALSHRIISPDGRWITFAGLALGNGGAGRRGFGPQNGCYIVPSDGSGPPQRVAAGSIAFFPPPPAG